jgi:formate/nitrite transporter FocA (FNT family)
MYFIPLGMLLQTDSTGVTITWLAFLRSLIPVILGNLVGGSVLVGLVYHVIYGRSSEQTPNN